MITQEQFNKMKGELDKLKNDNKYKFADKYTLTDKDSIYNGLRDFYKIYAMGLTRDRETSSEMNQLTNSIPKLKDKDDVVGASRALLGMYETIVNEVEQQLRKPPMPKYLLDRKDYHLKKDEPIKINLNKVVYKDTSSFTLESNLLVVPAKIELVFASSAGDNHKRTVDIRNNPHKDTIASHETANVPASWQVDVVQITLLNHEELHISFSLTE